MRNLFNDIKMFYQVSFNSFEMKFIRSYMAQDPRIIKKRPTNFSDAQIEIRSFLKHMTK